jgi:receptor expression-enhancing protein 1/2/3/4
MLFRLPFYYEAKVAFVVYLWHPRTQGALYLYTNVISPVLRKHEGLIDRKLAEGSSRFGDLFSSGMKR